MIQDIGAGRYRNEYQPIPPCAESPVLFYRGRELFVENREEGIRFLTYQNVTERFPELAGKETYLFSIDGMGYYLFREDAYEEAALAIRLEEVLETYFPDFSWEKIELLRTAAPKEAAFAGVTGFQLAGWYAARRFCPRCGKRMVHDERERMMRCESCGQTEYPKLCPAVIVGVTDGERLLLTRYAGRTHTRYALIAGFAEIGESIEDTVRREVMEEVGLKVGKLHYYKSQPWSFSDTLLMGFFAELDGSEEIHLDENELSEGRWCTREEIPEDDGLSLTREMMQVFRNGAEKGEGNN